jgi:hypothetical protein
LNTSTNQRTQHFDCYFLWPAPNARRKHVKVYPQEGPWTYGLLANHLWSFAGEGSRPDVNQTFLQPFLAYNTKTGFGVMLQTDSTYNWEAEQWTVPLGLFASQVLKLGGQPLSLQFGPRVYVDSPSGGPEWGLRFNLVLLFPK